MQKNWIFNALIDLYEIHYINANNIIHFNHANNFIRLKSHHWKYVSATKYSRDYVCKKCGTESYIAFGERPKCVKGYGISNFSMTRDEIMTCDEIIMNKVLE